jgi:hypothetical protein
MNAEFYNEAEVLNRYLEISVKFLMTDFERRSYYLAIKREKAKGLLADQLPRWLAQETEEVRQASLAGPKVIRQGIVDRIAREHHVNRCPKCHRIARTPIAKLCLWCGHNWHGT